jgi:hypothetical protein
MKVMLIDIDSVIPNLALHKIELYHQQRGDKVYWNMPIIPVDKTYVSCVFDYNKHKCKEWQGKAEIGGSGWSLEIELPPEIEAMKPKINYGFTTRGCVRKCPFCVVPKKEGYIRIIGDIYDFWDGHTKEIRIQDNNILGVPEHFKKIAAQCRKENLLVDFNGGFDCRLLTEDLCREIMTLKLVEKRFAFDSMGVKPAVLRACDILKKCGQKDWDSRWYVYAGPDNDFQDVFERLNILRERKQGCYLMRDRRCHDRPDLIALASWAGQMAVFTEASFPEALNTKRLSPYRKLFPQFDYTIIPSKEKSLIPDDRSFAEKYKL